MNSVALQENLEKLSTDLSRETFVFELLSAYEIPKSTITLLRNSPSKLSGKDNQIILKNKLLFHVPSGEDVHVTIDDLQKDKMASKYNPRFIIVTDFETLLAVDTKTRETLDIHINELGKHYAFFLPWAGMEKAQHVNENPADIRAASKMAKLYDQIINDSPDHSESGLHDLNIFLSRLLFCFFAEDTGIFPKTLFTNSLDSSTQVSGSDLGAYFDTLFDVLNAEAKDRALFAHHFTEFPYVNGGLFEKKIKLPVFTASSRKLIIECGQLDWSAINPDIFGSMIQAVVHPGQRENLGMHYTSVPNILKVIEPLFLDDLYEEFEDSKDSLNKLTKLRERIVKIKIFDPACGSGNFLIISYKELCKLEIKIIEKMTDMGQQNHMPLSGISLNSFFGIEIDDFAHEIARLSLWLAQHQMNLSFDDEFGIMKPTLPLKESGKIICGNATRLDWNEICPKLNYKNEPYEIYVIGNPPYYGAKKQNEDQRDDLKIVFKGNEKISNIDYISCWFFLAAKYIKNTNNKSAFVSTNSISQGEQVAVLWPLILRDEIEISFAHQSFKWQNSAKGNAGVTCVIIGLRKLSERPKYIYTDQIKHKVFNISPYLVEAKNLYICARNKPLSEVGEIILGSSGIDGGHLTLSKEERDNFILNNPLSKKFIKPFMGGSDFLSGTKRFCLWIDDELAEEANEIPLIKDRIDKCRAFRLSAGRDAKKAATVAHRFFYRKFKNSNAIILPMTSTERRDYMTVGYLDKGTVFSNGVLVIYNPELYIFSILTSKMHMVWVKAVAGRLKTDIRYSGTICYNTFPFPEITVEQKEALTGHVYNILGEREKYPDRTMAELYDPDKMPEGLRDAHKYLDLAIDQIYRNKPFENDEDRLAHLFKLYEEMISNETNK